MSKGNGKRTEKTISTFLARVSYGVQLLSRQQTPEFAQGAQQVRLLVEQEFTATTLGNLQQDVERTQRELEETSYQLTVARREKAEAEAKIAGLAQEVAQLQATQALHQRELHDAWQTVGGIKHQREQARQAGQQVAGSKAALRQEVLRLNTILSRRTQYERLEDRLLAQLQPMFIFEPDLLWEEAGAGNVLRNFLKRWQKVRGTLRNLQDIPEAVLAESSRQGH